MDVFVFAICVACVVGIALGESANLILLGYLPWAVCAAVLTSAFLHWVARMNGFDTSVAPRELDENKLSPREK
jgi:hypothetical protein